MHERKCAVKGPFAFCGLGVDSDHQPAESSEIKFGAAHVTQILRSECSTMLPGDRHLYEISSPKAAGACL